MMAVGRKKRKSTANIKLVCNDLHILSTSQIGFILNAITLINRKDGKQRYINKIYL